MDQSPDAIIQSAEAWLTKPIEKDVHSILDVSNELVAALQQLMQEEGASKQKLGVLIGQIKGRQKAITNLEMMDWVPVGGGHLAIGHRPSIKMGADLKLQNTTHVLTLLSEGEQAKSIQAIAVKNRMEWLWFSMESARPPGEERLQELADLFKKMTIILQEGGKIYLHCSAGIHRTGMISYAFLRFLDNDADRALALLKALRTKTSEDVGAERLTWGDEVIQKLKF